MGRTSKFSFPLPGRRGRSQPAQDGANAEEPKLTKAERLLGETGLGVQRNPTQARHQQTPSKSLNLKPSFMSLSIADSSTPDEFSEYEDDDEYLSDLPARNPKYTHSPRLNSVSEDRTNHYGLFKEESRGHPRSRSHSAVPLLRSFQSAGSLITPQRQTPFSRSIAPVQDTSPHLRKTSLPVYPDYRNRGESRLVPKPVRRVSEEKVEQKPRPPRLDLTRLFPRPSLSNISRPGSVRSVIAPSTPARPSTVAAHMPSLSTGSTTSINRSHQKHLSRSRGTVSPFPSVSPRPSTGSNPPPPLSTILKDPTSIRKNRPKPPKTKYWFDGLLELEDEDQELDLASEPPAEHEYYREAPSQIRSDDQYLHVGEHGTSIPPVPELSSLQPPSSRDYLTPIETRLQRNSLQGHYAQSMRASLVSETPELGSAPYEGYDEYSHSPMLNGMLKPPLLSVPSTPRPPSTVSSEFSEDSNLPRVRDSIALSEIDDAVSIVEAQAFHVQPSRLHRLGPRRLEGLNSPTRSHTEEHYPRPSSRHTSHTAYTTQTASFARPVRIGGNKHLQRSPSLADSGHFDAMTPKSAPGSIWNGRPGSAQHPPLPSRAEQAQKLMAVTEEEEALLEMMRRKRAAMASHSFAEGYRTALRQSPQSPVSLHFSTGSGPRSSIGNTSEMTVRSRSSRYDIVSVYDPPLSPPPSTALPSPPASDRGLTDAETPKMHPTGPKHAKLLSTSTVDSNLSVMTSFLDHPSESSPPTLDLEPVDVKFSPMNLPTPGMSQSPTPSNASHTSFLPSPVTPFNIPSIPDLSVRISGRSASSESSNGSAEGEAEPRKLPQSAKVINVRKRSATTDLTGFHVDANSRRTASLESNFTQIGSERRPSAQTINVHYAVEPMAEVQRPRQMSDPQCHSASTHDHSHLNCCDNDDGVRCSVSDDVLAAWGNLGGWTNFDHARV
jgi:hypothetical protein